MLCRRGTLCPPDTGKPGSPFLDECPVSKHISVQEDMTGPMSQLLDECHGPLKDPFHTHPPSDLPDPPPPSMQNSYS